MPRKAAKFMFHREDRALHINSLAIDLIVYEHEFTTFTTGVRILCDARPNAANGVSGGLEIMKIAARLRLLFAVFCSL